MLFQAKYSIIVPEEVKYMAQEHIHIGYRNRMDENYRLGNFRPGLPPIQVILGPISSIFRRWQHMYLSSSRKAPKCG